MRWVVGLVLGHRTLWRTVSLQPKCRNQRVEATLNTFLWLLEDVKELFRLLLRGKELFRLLLRGKELLRLLLRLTLAGVEGMRWNKGLMLLSSATTSSSSSSGSSCSRATGMLSHELSLVTSAGSSIALFNMSSGQANLTAAHDSSNIGLININKIPQWMLKSCDASHATPRSMPASSAGSWPRGSSGGRLSSAATTTRAWRRRWPAYASC